MTLSTIVLRLYFQQLRRVLALQWRYTFAWIMRRAASSIALLVLLFVTVQPSVAKVVVDAKPSAVSLAVTDRSVALTEPSIERGTAAHPVFSPAQNEADKDPHPFITEFYGPIADSADAKADKTDWKSKRIAQVRNVWKKAVSWIF